MQNILLVENGNVKRSSILLLGKNPERFSINTFAKIGKFGASVTDLKYQEIVEGNAYQPAKFCNGIERLMSSSYINNSGHQEI